jgi:HlyD family secretion protein
MQTEATNHMAEDNASAKLMQYSLDFAPDLLQIQHKPPSPLPRMVLRGLLVLLLALLLWAYFGRLDVVAVADGKLVPVTYLKIVQPADSGIVREIAVTEGQSVQAGQILVRMDANISEADSKTIQSELQHKQLELRRIKAELTNTSFTLEKGDDPVLFQRILAAYHANRQALQDSLATEQTSMAKARQDLASSVEVQHKLEKVLPTYQAQEQSYEELGKKGFAGKLMVEEKRRDRITAEQDLKAQQYNAESLNTTISQSSRRMAQIQSEYKQKLQAEQVALFAETQKLEQDWKKQAHKNSLLELKAPQAGIVKDLATHTPGTVVSPGTVLMTLVPNNEPLYAEVWVKNQDAGFVHPGQHVKLKLTAYPFQKYGMVDGELLNVSADSTDRPNAKQNQTDTTADTETNNNSFAYKAIVKLKQQTLQADQDILKLSSGMQVAAEIKLADQTVLEYLLSPVRKAFHEAGRER